jgi:hypothetical protein
MLMGSTLATGFCPVYGLRFSFTDNLFMLLSRSRTDIFEGNDLSVISLQEICFSCCWDVLEVRWLEFDGGWICKSKQISYHSNHDMALHFIVSFTTTTVLGWL